MLALLKTVICSERGQSATEYMLFLVFSITLSLIGFLLVPYFTDGFNDLLSRILGSSYYLSVY
jgi:hypothetical protein